MSQSKPLIGMVLVTHGRLAIELVAALEHVVGPQSQVMSVCIGPEDNMEQRRADIVKAVKTVDAGEGVVVLTDAVGTGATPNRANFGDLSILAGSNTETAWVKVDGVADCPQGDLDCSGHVDGADLGLLLSAWQSNACAADLNFDGRVDGADLGLLLANWG